VARVLPDPGDDDAACDFFTVDTVLLRRIYDAPMFVKPCSPL
jgi:hypothetical protein